MRYCWLFPAGIPHRRVGTHVFLSRSPLPPRRVNVRLACIRHAASVDPEPGSNSSSCVSRAAPCRNSGHARSILIMHQACDERLSIHPRHTRQLVRYRADPEAIKNRVARKPLVMLLRCPSHCFRSRCVVYQTAQHLSSPNLILLRAFRFQQCCRS